MSMRWGKPWLCVLRYLGIGAVTALVALTAQPTGAARGQTPPARMALIPAGSFQMGDSFGEGNSDELPVHAVDVSAFHMDPYEVTKALWDEVASWAASNGYDIKPEDGQGHAPDHPVMEVSWHEAVKWANARSEKEGLVPCYYTSALQDSVYRNGILNVADDGVKWSACGYRLPTEAEWEYAARGGVADHRFPWGDTDNILHELANYYSCAPELCNGRSFGYDTSPTRGYQPDYVNDPQPYTSPVGSFGPNGYGLYDMAGNVWEWGWDWYDEEYYAGSPGSDPRGPGSGSYRILRGGGWFNDAASSRVANRNGASPNNSGSGLGFRLVRTAL